MALLIAPLFTAGIAVGGIQNVYAGVPSQDWTLTLTNSNSGKTFTWTHAEFGDCVNTSSVNCALPVSDGKLRKCINSSTNAVVFNVQGDGMDTNPCKGPWTVTLTASGTEPFPLIVF